MSVSKMLNGFEQQLHPEFFSLLKLALEEGWIEIGEDKDGKIQDML